MVFSAIIWHWLLSTLRIERRRAAARAPAAENVFLDRPRERGVRGADQMDQQAQRWPHRVGKSYAEKPQHASSEPATIKMTQTGDQAQRRRDDRVEPLSAIDQAGGERRAAFLAKRRLRYYHTPAASRAEPRPFEVVIRHGK